eukprot:3717692-Pleurochrysis_carterae.AAC.1
MTKYRAVQSSLARTRPRSASATATSGGASGLISPSLALRVRSGQNGETCMAKSARRASEVRRDVHGKCAPVGRGGGAKVLPVHKVLEEHAACEE